jgi:glutaredoxin
MGGQSRARLATTGDVKGDKMKKEANVYVLPTSQDTDKIKDYLASKGIDFKVYDIGSDVKAHKRMIEATRGACGAPVVEIGHKIVCGLDKGMLDETIRTEL